MYVLCILARDEAEKSQAYVWKGQSFEPTESPTEDYIQAVIEEHFVNRGIVPDRVEIIEECPADETDEFINYFD